MKETLDQATDIAEAVTDPEVEAYLEKLREHHKDTVEREAKKRVRKNRFEIRRLNKHATQCLIDGNKDGYIYAIGKLRSITGQSVSVDILETLWQTSYDQVVKIATSFSEAKSNLPDGQNFSQ